MLRKMNIFIIKLLQYIEIYAFVLIDNNSFILSGF